MTYTDRGHVITMMSLVNYRKWKQSKLDKMEKSICPVCEQKAFIEAPLGGECMNCFWYPISIPYGEDDVNEAKIKLEQSKNK